MSSEVRELSDGTFTLEKSGDPNVFYFYRNDGEEVGEVGSIPIYFYQRYSYLRTKDKGTVAMNDFYLKTSENGKCIVLTISEVAENRTDSKMLKFLNFIQKFKRFISKIFK